MKWNSPSILLGRTGLSRVWGAGWQWWRDECGGTDAYHMGSWDDSHEDAASRNDVDILGCCLLVSTGCWKKKMPVPFKEMQLIVFVEGLWSTLSIAALVNTPVCVLRGQTAPTKMNSMLHQLCSSLTSTPTPSVISLTGCFHSGGKDLSSADGCLVRPWLSSITSSNVLFRKTIPSL